MPPCQLSNQARVMARGTIRVKGAEDEWPVRADWMANSACLASRNLADENHVGSCRNNERRALAKVSDGGL